MSDSGDAHLRTEAERFPSIIHIKSAEQEAHDSNTHIFYFLYEPVFQDLVSEREAGAEQGGVNQNAEHFSN